jgi:hypothetical protein
MFVGGGNDLGTFVCVICKKKGWDTFQSKKTNKNKKKINS